MIPANERTRAERDARAEAAVAVHDLLVANGVLGVPISVADRLVDADANHLNLVEVRLDNRPRGDR